MTWFRLAKPSLRFPPPAYTHNPFSSACQVRNFLEPGSLEGLSLGTMLLALVGNTLMLPRALFTWDPVWICCTSWGMVAGWGQLMSMAMGAAPATGQPYLAAAPFVAISVLLVAFVVFSLLETQRHRRKTLESVWDTDY